MNRGPRRWRAGGHLWRGVLGAVLILALGGCRVDAEVRVHAREDGSGWVRVTVTFDSDAIARLGGDPAGALALEDLQAAGWQVDGPRRGSGQSVSVSAIRDFARPEQVRDLLEQVDGPGGVLRDADLVREVRPGRTTVRFATRFDPAGGLGAFADEALAAALDGEPLGRSLDDMARATDQPVASMAGLVVRVDLPGEPRTDAAVSGRSATWILGLDDPPTVLRASSTSWRWSSVALAGLGLAMAVAALVVLVRSSGARRAGRASRVRRVRGRSG